MDEQSIVHRLYRNAAARPDSDAYFYQQDGRWIGVTWAGYARRVQAVAQAMTALGVGRGDTIVVTGSKRPAIAHLLLAAMHVGAVVVVKSGSATADHVDAVISIDDTHVYATTTMSYRSFLAMGDDVALPPLQRTVLDDTAVVIAPENIHLSHQNVAWVAHAFCTRFDMHHAARMVSPDSLTTADGQLFQIYAPITGGYCVWFDQTVDGIPQSLRDIRPTIISSTAAMWETLRPRIQSNVDLRDSRLLRIARQITLIANQRRYRGRYPRGLRAMLLTQLNHRLHDQVKRPFGLQNLRRAMVRRSAPADLARFFAALDVRLHGYFGTASTSGLATCNDYYWGAFGTAGIPLPDTNVKIATDGEIWVRGPQTVGDDWLATGRYGRMKNGFLVVQDAATI